MDVLNPVRSLSNQWKPLARRSPSLRGRRIGVLDNSKPNAGVLLERVGALLAARGGARAVRAWSKPGASTGAAPAVIEEIAAAARVALTASAD